MRGTWQTTDHGGGRGALIALAVLVLLGSGAAAELAAAIAAVLITAVVVVVVIIVALVILIRRRPAADSEAFQHQAEALRVYAARQDRPQVAASGPAEVHYHTHLHIGPGADAAGIIRQTLSQPRDAITEEKP